MASTNLRHSDTPSLHLFGHFDAKGRQASNLESMIGWRLELIARVVFLFVDHYPLEI